MNKYLSENVVISQYQDSHINNKEIRGSQPIINMGILLRFREVHTNPLIFFGGKEA